jgi:hypothetical protein
MSVLVSVALEYVGIYVLKRDESLVILADSFPFAEPAFINITQKKVKKEVQRFASAEDDSDS